ncbi:hypothetical protein LXL04_010921 [Taraxacum kok-saghyz]
MANRQPQLTAATHLTTKLTSHNYPVWRKQVESTLISLELEDYITGESNQPFTTINDKDGKPIPNPEYRPWYRKDQMIFSAILGSCPDSIQPLISSASTAREAWERLHSSFASSSRSRIISLKSKLAQNLKEFLHEMRSIADNLALAQSPVSEEDLMVHILSQLGDDYRTIAAAIKVRENPISYSKLFDKLTDYERALTDTPSTLESIPTTVNYTTRQQGSTNKNPNSFSRNNRAYHSGSQRGAHQSQSQWSNNNHNRTNKTNEFCQFSNIPGHLTRDCRKLARFLKDNNVQADKNTTLVANVTTSSPASPSWLFDTGASNHITSDRRNLHSVSEYGGPDEVVLGDGSGLPISNIGTTYINTPHKQLLLSNVLHVPRLRRNLVSVGHLCDTNRVSVEFFSSHLFVKDLCTGARLMRGERTEGVYHTRPSPRLQINTTFKHTPLSLHHKLGHPSTTVFKFIASKLGLGSKIVSNVHCPSCSINKSHKLPFGPNSFTATHPLQLLYSDVWGPVQKSIDGYTYYVIFVDYFTKYIWIYPMKHKSDVAHIFPQFKLLVEKYFQHPIVSLFNDNGDKYLVLLPFLQSHGISHYTTPPHTPEQNGIAERRHRHIVETGLALLHYANLPLTYWSHAFQTTVYLINRLPTAILDNKSPYECLFHQQPNYTKLKPFGCLCYPWLRPYTTSKLQPRSAPCVFLGYSSSKSAFKCYDLETKRLYHSRHVEFIPDQFPSHRLPPDSPLPTPDIFLAPSSLITDDVTTPSQPTPTNPPQVPIPNIIQLPLPTDPILTPSHDTDPSSPTSDSPNPTSSPVESSPTSPPISPQVPPSPPPPQLPPTRPRKQNPKYYIPSFINTATLHPIPPTVEPNTHNQALQDPH